MRVRHAGLSGLYNRAQRPSAGGRNQLGFAIGYPGISLRTGSKPSNARRIGQRHLSEICDSLAYAGGGERK